MYNSAKYNIFHTRHSDQEWNTEINHQIP